MIISSVKVSLQNKRWEVCVVWEGFPMVLRVGTGDTIEEATLNALNQVMQDAREARYPAGLASSTPTLGRDPSDSRSGDGS